MDERLPSLTQPPWPDLGVETLRQLLDAGICPECGQGPFTAIAHHFGRKHGISSAAVKEQALLRKDHGLTSPEFHERLSERRKRSYAQLREEGRGLTTQDYATRDGERKMSATAIRANRANAQRMREMHPDWQTRIQAGGAKVPHAQHVEAGKAAQVALRAKYDREAWRAVSLKAQAKRAKIPRDRYDEVKQLRASGLSSDEVAARFGVSRTLINQITSGRKDLPYLGRLAPNAGGGA